MSLNERGFTLLLYPYISLRINSVMFYYLKSRLSLADIRVLSSQFHSLSVL